MEFEHPISELSLKAGNFKCFGETPEGFESFGAFNIVVGRNNSGKSSLIDMVEAVIENGANIRSEHLRSGTRSKFLVGQNLSERELRPIFSESASRGGVPGASHWAFGAQLIGKSISRVLLDARDVASIEDRPDEMSQINSGSLNNYLDRLKDLPNPFSEISVVKIAAERDILRETANNDDGNLIVDANGRGATNLVRAFLNRDNLPRELVEETLLGDLNRIYASDNFFLQIACQEDGNGNWEIFLKESSKGLIRISESGSGLKTILLVLINFLLVPKRSGSDLSKTVFAFEELENNLHPALLRRLFQYLAEKQADFGSSFVLTTHSSVTIDWFSRREDSQIIHVSHDGECARCARVSTYLDNRNVLDDLEVRASDILQSNGIIWVEGPSDRYYMRRWIELWSGGALVEGTHYQCLFYGGRLLSHLDSLPPDDVEKGVSLLAANRNVAIVIDSDRKKTKSGSGVPRVAINKTKRRVRGEVLSVGGMAWITDGREVENYIPPRTLQKFLNRSTSPKIDKYDCVFDKYGLGKYRDDKVGFAEELSSLFEVPDLRHHLDLEKQLTAMCANICRWNGI